MFAAGPFLGMGLPELVILAILLIPIVYIIAILIAILRRRKNVDPTQELTALKQQLEVAQEKLDATQTRLELQQHRLEAFDASFLRMDSLIRDEFGRSREESQGQQRATREETSKTLRENREELGKQFKEIRESMEKQLGSMQSDNAVKLEEMRKTVDEKLQETVEKRFSESFALISTRLEEVHKGLGEMQSLASGVSDLNNVLSNVKARGTFGEYQLGAILEQYLSPEQFTSNAQTKKRSQERVEFAIRLPGRGEDGVDEVLLPIDSKFPIEDYERLLNAYDGKSDEKPEELIKRLVISLKTFARTIHDKYLNPPLTTEFAIMFVPTESLYAEILRIPGLSDQLQREFQVVVVGPTNLVAFLNSLQMGFRSLAVEKRSSEVWTLLGQVKTEFGKFTGVLESVKKKLDAASNEIGRVETRTRVISGKLRKVQGLPVGVAAGLLEATDAADAAEETGEAAVIEVEEE
ncbi:MAG: DNA recombination protein RmuC [Coriobacteriia bacterium]|nr:DNA recombination protein RmuC [Coriobacteriia bacterium]